MNDPAIRVTTGPLNHRALADWWARWEELPQTQRDRPVADVLAEQRDID